MRQALLIIDVQSTFSPPDWLILAIQRLTPHVYSVATVEQHDEAVTPFLRQLDWKPKANDKCLVIVDCEFIKNGYAPTSETIQHLKQMNLDRVLVCGIQTDTCVLAAGFTLFDCGLTPTLVKDLTIGSSLDPSGQLGIALWEHHFRNVTTSQQVLAGVAFDGKQGAT